MPTFSRSFTVPYLGEPSLLGRSLSSPVAASVTPKRNASELPKAVKRRALLVDQKGFLGLMGVSVGADVDAKRRLTGRRGFCNCGRGRTRKCELVPRVTPSTIGRRERVNDFIIAPYQTTTCASLIVKRTTPLSTHRALEHFRCLRQIYHRHQATPNTTSKPVRNPHSDWGRGRRTPGGPVRGGGPPAN